MIVRRLAEVSFSDSSFDSKGAAFEYYVKATLKGKKLGQDFTPRAVVHFMSVLVGRQKIANSILTGSPVRVLDPACGTGGFLVYLMKQSLDFVERQKKGRKADLRKPSCGNDRHSAVSILWSGCKLICRVGGKDEYDYCG